MNRKKGFTLIELLAVITILAILAIIVIPIVANVINDSRKSGFERSVDGLVIAAQTDYAENIYTKLMTYNYQDGKLISPSGTSVPFSGTIHNGTGTIYISSNGYAVSVTDGDYCASKSFSANEVTITEDSSCNNVDIQDALIDEYQNRYSGSIDNSAFSVAENNPSRLIGGDNNPPSNFIIPAIVNNNKITSIGRGGDFSEKNITSVILPPTLVTIGSNAFSVNKITSLVIPDYVETIEYEAFRNNPITKLTLGNRLKEIQDEAFAHTDISEVTIPASVTSIAAKTFSGCDNLTTIINKTGKAFDWEVILGFLSEEDDTEPSVTGTFTSPDGGRTVRVIKG